MTDLILEPTDLDIGDKVFKTESREIYDKNIGHGFLEVPRYGTIVALSTVEPNHFIVEWKHSYGTFPDITREKYTALTRTSNFNRFRGHLGKYRVEFDISAEESGREVIEYVEVFHKSEAPYHLAFRQLERRLIEEGYPTFEECGCCLTGDTPTGGKFKIHPDFRIFKVKS